MHLSASGPCSQCTSTVKPSGRVLPSLTPCRGSLGSSILRNSHRTATSLKKHSDNCQAHLSDDQPSTSAPPLQQTLPGGSNELHPLVAAAGTAAVLCTLVAAVQPAHAEERAWKPRRHYRRLGERVSNTWADDVVNAELASLDRKAQEKLIQERLRAEREQAESARRKAEEEVQRQRKQRLLQQQLAAERYRTNLPFSIRIGDVDYAPHVVWGAIGLVALSVARSLLSSILFKPKAAKRQGRWVYDRSLGGKKVWVPAEGSDTGIGGEPRPAISEAELQRLTSIAAAAAGGKSATSAATSASSVPSWWDPIARFPPDDVEEAEALRKEAEVLLSRLQAAKNHGQDYRLKDIMRLREVCQEGGFSVKPQTVGGRDSMYRAAVEAVIKAAVEPTEQQELDLGDDVTPTRFLTTLADDIGMPPQKAGAMVSAAASASARARLIEALAGSKAGDEMRSVLALVSLCALAEKVPVLTAGSGETALIAESLQATFSVDDRKRVFYLAGQLYPDAAPLFASLLGFQPELVVPQLMADLAAYKDSDGKDTNEGQQAAGGA